MIPHSVPTYSCSAACPESANIRRSGDSTPASTVKAYPTESSSAAEADRPAPAGTSLSMATAVVIVGKAVVFLIGALALGLVLTPRLFGWASRLRGTGILLTTALVLCFGLSYVAAVVGLAAIVGAYAAGLILEDVHYRVFTEREIDYCERVARKAERYATRFAAKEAARKALGAATPVAALSWHDVEIISSTEGAPQLQFHGRAAEIAEKLKIVCAHVSLSHAQDRAVAFVVLEVCDTVRGASASGSLDQ